METPTFDESELVRVYVGEDLNGSEVRYVASTNNAWKETLLVPAKVLLGRGVRQDYRHDPLSGYAMPFNDPKRVFKVTHVEHFHPDALKDAELFAGAGKDEINLGMLRLAAATYGDYKVRTLEEQAAEELQWFRELARDVEVPIRMPMPSGYDSYTAEEIAMFEHGVEPIDTRNSKDLEATLA